MKLYWLSYSSRSGSTYLANQIANKGIAVLPELGIYSQLAREAKGSKLIKGHRALKLLTESKNKNIFDNWMDEEVVEFKYNFNSEGNYHFEGVIKEIARCYFYPNLPDVVLVKKGGITWNLDTRHAFNSINIIYLYRDIVPVFESQSRTSYSQGGVMLSNGVMGLIKEYMLMIADAYIRKFFSKNKLITIKFEDLENVESIIDKIFGSYLVNFNFRKAVIPYSTLCAHEKTLKDFCNNDDKIKSELNNICRLKIVNGLFSFLWGFLK